MITDMDTNGTALTVTSGQLTVGSTYQIPGNVCPYDYYWPQPTYQIYPLYPLTYITYPSKPLYCCDDCHVFACEHAAACKCGKATRRLEPKRCDTCGKQ